MLYQVGHFYTFRHEYDRQETLLVIRAYNGMTTYIILTQNASVILTYHNRSIPGWRIIE